MIWVATSAATIVSVPQHAVPTIPTVTLAHRMDGLCINSAIMNGSLATGMVHSASTAMFDHAITPPYGHKIQFLFKHCNIRADETIVKVIKNIWEKVTQHQWSNIFFFRNGYWSQWRHSRDSRKKHIFLHSVFYSIFHSATNIFMFLFPQTDYGWDKAR